MPLRRTTLAAWVIAAVGIAGAASPAAGQMGILTAAVGSGRLTHEDDVEGGWRIGEPVEEGDRLVTDAGGYAMIFFVSGLWAAEMQFEGTIVVDVDENTEVQIRRGRGLRAPIDIHVTKGRVRAFFDAGEHRDYILLSTPLGELQVTGSAIYAAHDDTDEPGSELGSFDSDCVVRPTDGAELSISRGEKATLAEGREPTVAGMTAADLDSWKTFPDLNLAAAMTLRGEVRGGYVRQSWVEEYLAGGEELANVGVEQSANIPSQVAEAPSTTPTTGARVAVIATRGTRSRLRASGGGRSVGDDDGIGRDTFSPRLAAEGPANSRLRPHTVNSRGSAHGRSVSTTHPAMSRTATRR